MPSVFRSSLAAVATFALLVGALATPANASHMSIYIYSPYTNSNWYFTQGDHPGWMNGQAHDVGWPSTPSSIVFNATAGVTATVTTVSLNCYQAQTWDKYVGLSLSYGGQLYGNLNYVHITSPTVSVGQVISPGTSLGAAQSQSSPCWLGPHAHMEKSSNGTWGGGDFICGLNCPSGSQFAYSTWMIRMLHSNIERPE
jgi:hypothetical protein